MTKQRLQELMTEIDNERLGYGEIAEIEMAAVEHGIVMSEDMMAVDMLIELERVL